MDYSVSISNWPSNVDWFSMLSLFISVAALLVSLNQNRYSYKIDVKYVNEVLEYSNVEYIKGNGWKPITVGNKGSAQLIDIEITNNSSIPLYINNLKFTQDNKQVAIINLIDSMEGEVRLKLSSGNRLVKRILYRSYISVDPKSFIVYSFPLQIINSTSDKPIHISYSHPKSFLFFTCIRKTNKIITFKEIK